MKIVTVFFITSIANCKLLSFQDIDFPDLTTEQRIELCKKVPCKVELFHSNVCHGVEKGWPKRMFKKDNFRMLNPKEQRCIWRDMERKAVFLYGTYVDEKRLADRRRRRTTRALAPHYELIYRKNLFLRIKALGEPAPGNDEIINESEILSDSEADLSLQTVINTGNTGTQKSNVDRQAIIDLIENDCSSDVMSENAERRNGRATPRNWKSKSTYTITENFQITEIDDMDNNNGIIASESPTYNVEMSESRVSSSEEPQDSESESQNQFGHRIPEVQSHEFSFGTPSIHSRRNQINGLLDVDAESESDLDSLDFLTQGLTAQTSTQ